MLHITLLSGCCYFVETERNYRVGGLHNNVGIFAVRVDPNMPGMHDCPRCPSPSYLDDLARRLVHPMSSHRVSRQISRIDVSLIATLEKGDAVHGRLVSVRPRVLYLGQRTGLVDRDGHSARVRSRVRGCEDCVGRSGRCLDEGRRRVLTDSGGYYAADVAKSGWGGHPIA